MKNIFLLTTLLLITGCTTISEIKGMSSGHIGCLPSEISISNQVSTSTTMSWVATCKDIEYVCNRDMSSFAYVVKCTKRNE